MEQLVVGMDIGGTKTLIGLVDQQGTVIAKCQFPTNILCQPEEHLSKCINVAKQLMNANGIGENSLLGVGVNVPGLADSKEGILIYAPYAQWRNVKVRKFIQQFWTDKQVEIANDVNACAIGELLFGKGKDLNDFLWVTVSTGIGGGVIINRQLAEGNALIAGEVGHVVVEWVNGHRCSCGNHGCLEAYSSGTAIAEHAKRIIECDKEGELATYFNGRNIPITAEHVAKAAYEGVRPAIGIFQHAGNYLGRAFSYAINLLNPGAIFVGGGVCLSYDLLEPSIREVLRASVISELNKQVPIITTGLGYNAGLIGAASLVYWRELCYNH